MPIINNATSSMSLHGGSGIRVEDSAIRNGLEVVRRPLINDGSTSGGDCSESQESVGAGWAVMVDDSGKGNAIERNWKGGGDGEEEEGEGRAMMKEGSEKLIRGRSGLCSGEYGGKEGRCERGVGSRAKVKKGREKGRLSVEQVRVLERAFQEEGSRVEGQRKGELARAVGLQARQVAVWFQNKRARSKSQQLCLEFESLQQHVDSLLAHRDSLLAENAKLAAEVSHLLARCVVPISLQKLMMLTLEGEPEKGDPFPQRVSSLKSCLSFKERCMGNSSTSGSSILQSEEVERMECSSVCTTTQEDNQHHFLAPWDDMPTLWALNSSFPRIIDPIFTFDAQHRAHGLPSDLLQFDNKYED